MVHKLVGTPSSEVKIPSIGWESLQRRKNGLWNSTLEIPFNQPSDKLEDESPLGKKTGSFPMSLSKLAF